jgi:hypothetical protein
LTRFFFIPLILFTTALFAQLEEARRITERLCSEEFFGRGYVNNGMESAALFLKEEFINVGLQPYSKKFDFFQSYTYDVNSFPGNMEIIHNNKSLKPGIHFLPEASSPSMKLSADYAYIDSAILVDENLLKDAIESVYLGNKNAFLIDSRGFDDNERVELIRFAFNFTSTAPTFVTTDQKFTWSVGRHQLKYPLIQIQDSIFEIGQTLDVDIEAKFIENFEANNVIGFLPTKKKRAKTLIFCAHYDHLGGMGKDVYIPGANDNASGTAMLITLANYFKNNPSKYNMLFIAFSGEEAGLLGSEYFVANSPLKLKKIRFVLNLDIMGSGEEGITVVNATEYPNEFELLTAINNEKNLLPRIKSRGETSNSDHYFFHQNGVPSFFIYTMGANKNYHDVFDTYDALSFEAYNNVMKLLQTFVERL